MCTLYFQYCIVMYILPCICIRVVCVGVYLYTLLLRQYFFYFQLKTTSLERCGETDFSQQTDLSSQYVVLPLYSFFPNERVLQ